MKKNLLKYYIATFYLCSTFAMFAQTDPGTGGGVENDGTTDTTPAAPIDEKLILLALAGIVFAYYTFKKYKKHSAV